MLTVVVYISSIRLNYFILANLYLQQTQLMEKIMFKKFLEDTNGATAIEYGLIAALVCLATIGGITAVGSNTTVTMNNISNQF